MKRNGLFSQAGDGLARPLLWVALSFTLTSGVYLSWLDHLVALGGAKWADWGSLVAGYLLQAAGLAFTVCWFRKKPAGSHRSAFLTAVALFAVITVPTLLTDSLAGALLFGLAMNALCGVIAGFYLYEIGRRVPEGNRSLAFGGGYALATVAVGLGAIFDGGRLIHGPWGVAIAVALAGGLCWYTWRGDFLAAFPEKPAHVSPGSPFQTDPKPLPPRQLWAACGLVVLISLVKNLGYGFPSADIQAGLIPEISRIPYALGLAAAGLIHDRNRRYGLMCTLFALMIPFLMLGLIHEPVSSAVFWGLDYIFYAFFTVFRVTLMLDLAERTERWELAPLGLLAGRIGDAAGTAMYLALQGRTLWLISAAAVLFVFAGFRMFRLYERMYEPEETRKREEQKIFEAFCAQNDFSAREKEICRLILDGRTNGEIAEMLYITENTVKYHVRNVLQKTGCRNRGELQQKYGLLVDPESQKPSLRAV